MPYNSLGFTFNPLISDINGLAPFPSIKQFTSNLTNAALVALGYSTVAMPALTGNALFLPTTAAFSMTLVLAAAVHKTMTLYCPSDQAAIVLNNESTAGPLTGGWLLNPGVAITLTPYSDPMYGVGSGGASNIYYVIT